MIDIRTIPGLDVLTAAYKLDHENLSGFLLTDLLAKFDIMPENRSQLTSQTLHLSSILKRHQFVKTSIVDAPGASYWALFELRAIPMGGHLAGSMTKLTDYQRMLIAADRMANDTSFTELARQYGVSPGTISGKLNENFPINLLQHRHDSYEDAVEQGHLFVELNRIGNMVHQLAQDFGLPMTDVRRRFAYAKHDDTLSGKVRVTMSEAEILVRLQKLHDYRSSHNHRYDYKK